MAEQSSVELAAAVGDSAGGGFGADWPMGQRPGRGRIAFKVAVALVRRSRRPRPKP